MKDNRDNKVVIILLIVLMLLASTLVAIFIGTDDGKQVDKNTTEIDTVDEDEDATDKPVATKKTQKTSKPSESEVPASNSNSEATEEAVETLTTDIVTDNGVNTEPVNPAVLSNEYNIIEDYETVPDPELKGE